MPQFSVVEGIAGRTRTSGLPDLNSSAEADPRFESCTCHACQAPSSRGPDVLAGQAILVGDVVGGDPAYIDPRTGARRRLRAHPSGYRRPRSLGPSLFPSRVTLLRVATSIASFLPNGNEASEMLR